MSDETPSREKYPGSSCQLSDWSAEENAKRLDRCNEQIEE